MDAVNLQGIWTPFPESDTPAPVVNTGYVELRPARPACTRVVVESLVLELAPGELHRVECVKTVARVETLNIRQVANIRATNVFIALGLYDVAPGQAEIEFEVAWLFGSYR